MRITMEHHSINQGIPDELILSLHAAADDKVWIGTHNEGFGTYNSKKQMFFSQFPKWSHGPVQEIISLGDHIYIGTEEKGLWAYSLPHQTLFSIHKSAEIDQRSIADMAVDRKNNLWVAYGQSELQLINHQFEYYEIEQGPIQAILPDRENSVWIGTPTGLFQKHLDRPDLPITHHIPQYTLNIISLDRDSLGRLWLGTFGQGLFCYDPDTGQISSLTEASGLLNNSILSINIQTDEVWLASLGGAFKIEFEPKPAHYNFSISPQIDGLGSSYIYQIFPAKNGRIWFATDGRGLSYLENDHVVTIGASESGKSIKTVYSITEDKQHRIWFISGTDEVYYQTANGFRSFDRIKTGLNLAGITTTYTGDIMVSHQDGLIMINPANFNISYLSEEYELDNLKPHLNTFAIDSIGNIWMGSNQRVLKHRVSQSPYQDVPTTHITQILLFDEPVQNKVDLKFAPRENFIAFKYVGISFLNASKVRYRYRLEGYDRDWNYTRDQRVSYSHLPAGTYTFKVQASINDEFNSSEITSSSFQIRKAFYNHAGFWVFMVLLSYRLIYLFAKSREKKLQKIAKQKREQIEFQYHQLQNQINPHFLFNSYNTLLSIIEEKPETASEYVEKLSDFYRQIIMLKEKDIVTVSEEIELVKNYFYLLQNRYGAHIDLRIDVHSTEKHLAPMSLQMLVENAVKHNIISKKHPLSIEIYEDQDKIVVMNNLQPKLHAEPSTGFGLNNIRERYKLLSGEPVEIFTSSNQFSVSLPLVTKPSYV